MDESSESAREYREWVLVRSWRPEAYEDVCDELVAEDAIVPDRGWRWEIADLTEPAKPDNS